LTAVDTVDVEYKSIIVHERIVAFIRLPAADLLGWVCATGRRAERVVLPLSEQ
jgi:hypothetical protein